MLKIVINSLDICVPCVISISPEIRSFIHRPSQQRNSNSQQMNSILQFYKTEKKEAIWMEGTLKNIGPDNPPFNLHMFLSPQYFVYTFGTQCIECTHNNFNFPALFSVSLNTLPTSLITLLCTKFTTRALVTNKKRTFTVHQTVLQQTYI
jgi:hypothetical protein